MFDARTTMSYPRFPASGTLRSRKSVNCAVKPHVLRYWEQEFPQLSPVKRRGNRRYYQREDVELVRTVRSLLYSQGYTIGGARQRLSNERREPTPVEFRLRFEEAWRSRKSAFPPFFSLIPHKFRYDPRPFGA